MDVATALATAGYARDGPAGLGSSWTRARLANLLTGGGYDPKEIEVLAVEIPDHPGSVSAVGKPLEAAGINVHCRYPHLGRIHGHAIVILGADKPEQAQEVLAANWVKILGREVYNV